MPNAQYSPQRLAYSYYAAGSTNVDTGDYAAANMNKAEDRTQSCRTTSVAAGTKIALDLGVGVAVNVPVAAFMLEGVNFSSLQIQASLSASPGTLVNAGTFVPILDKEDRRRKLLCIPSITWNHRYITLTPTSPDAGATYYEIQNFTAWSPLNTLLTNLEVPYRKTHFDKAELIDLGSAGEEVGPSPAIRLIISGSAKFDRDAALAAHLDQYQEIAAIPRNRVWLFHENQGDLSKCYHVQRADSVEIVRNAGTWEVSNLTMREVA